MVEGARRYTEKLHPTQISHEEHGTRKHGSAIMNFTGPGQADTIPGNIIRIHTHPAAQQEQVIVAQDDIDSAQLNLDRARDAYEQLVWNDWKAGVSWGPYSPQGVALENGEEIDGRLVVSALDVKRTFLQCLDRGDVPDAFRHRVENFKIRGSSGKLNIALDGLPTFPALPEGSTLMHSDMHFIDSMERMERAYDDWKAAHQTEATDEQRAAYEATHRDH